ncbi:type I-B CRISPR-associated protein Cas5b [Clostridium perfringens]|uniref:type I-B CRISPR-associated protein Cas5b n=1 Tax=Clostridium perfringens TaxID=1502 RepID=UPI0024BC7553|nr:type I-B CRISPR-associated protein Cas5b [Clostridium perfringens]
MKALKFTLEGKTGFFKRPDVNSNLYFTYGHIHKVALLGILGAILGYGGYNQKNSKYKGQKSSKEESKLPEFYEKLKDLKVSIVPNNKNGVIGKKINIFNNSVGYASQEQGGNLIVKEQWLENPSWEIYILLDNEEAEKLSKAMINKNYVYLPYLGKNDHMADILNCEICECEESLEVNYIDSFFKKDTYKLSNKPKEDDFDDFSEFDEFSENNKDVTKEEPLYKYEEFLPLSLDAETSMYKTESLVYTNSYLEKEKDSLIYKIKDKTIQFI